MLAKSKADMIKESIQESYDHLNSVEKAAIDQQLVTYIGEGCFLPTAKCFRADRLKSRNKGKKRKRKRKR